MHRSRRSAALGMLLFGLSLSGTAALAQSPETPGGTMLALEGTTWALTQVEGAADPAIVPGMAATLTLADGQASGFGGCNQFTTSYVLDGQSLSFEVPSSTMMACADAVMSFESVYLGALPTVANYAIASDSLQLLDGSGATALTFVVGGPAASAAPVASAVPVASAAPVVSAGPGASAVPATTGAPTSLVGAWTVTQLNDGTGGIAAAPTQPALTVSFGADGTVQGFGGCNQFSGPYVSGGDTIGIGPLNATMMACGDAVDTTEQQLLAALQAATVWSLRGDQLELRDDSGTVQVELSFGAAAPAA